MKRIVLMTIAAALVALPISAQQRDARPERTERAERTERPDKGQWLKDMREYKHEFLAKRIDLTRDQRDKFFATYDAMDDELMRVGNEARQVERTISQRAEEGANVTETEYEQAVYTLLELKNKEYQIETQGYEQLSKILTKKQLYDLRRAERDFTKTMMRKHRDLKEKR